MFFAVALLVLPTALCSGFPLQERAVDFFSPVNGGGLMLDNSSGLGEPLNVIISGLSSPEVLTDDGFLNWARSIGFSTECFGIHIGAPQTANLGDGNGPLPEIKVLREDFGDADIGTCLESVIGGNHFRYWRQNGSRADSGALFLAVSREENATEDHTIASGGYDIGRNELVEAAVGCTSFGGVTYATTSRAIAGLLPAGSAGINHGITIDGIVQVLIVTIQSVSSTPMVLG